MRGGSYIRCGLALTVALLASAAGLRAQEPTRPEERPKQPALRTELLRRVAEDQAVRNAYVEWLRSQKPGEQAPGTPEARKLGERMAKVDHANTQWLKGVVKRWGWPGKTLVGTDGAHSAWLLVQHADRDRPFQKQCLVLIEQAAAKGEASKIDLAYLTDRVLVAEDKPQRYGTQLQTKDGKLVLSPVEDEANLDKLRAAAGMPPIAQYLEQVRAVYGPKGR